MDKKPRVIVITGSNSGIGKQIALLYAKQGRNKLVLAARNEDTLKEVTYQCKELGSEATYVVTDVEHKHSCRKLIETAIRTYDRIDLLILNAGVSMHSPFEQLSESDLHSYHKMMNINFFGYVYCTYYALPYLKQSKGQIGVVGSLSGELGLPLRSGYCASKFAVKGFFESLRTEIPSDVIHITIVSPGSVRTNMREHALPVTGSSIQFNEDDSKKMSVEECAKQAVCAIENKKLDVVMTTSGKLAVLFKPILPSLVRKIAARKSGGKPQAKL